MLGVSLLVIIIAQERARGACTTTDCERDPLVAGFEQAAQRALGNDARIRTAFVTADPGDEDSSAQPGFDGVIELSFTSDGNEARIHCYVSKEHRWFDRKISFGESRGSLRRETTERGRLLGFAVATIFTTEAEPPPATAPLATLSTPTPAVAAAPRTDAEESNPAPPAKSRRSLEFAAIASTGLNGTAAGIGAGAGLRLALSGPIWARLVLAGRTGNIPEAQASDRTVLAGGGLALQFSPETDVFQLGVRADLLASYFETSHLSEDDIRPDRRSRWQAGADVVAEAGLRFAAGAGLAVGVGAEGMLGKTEIYTHGSRVAVVAPLRAIAEVGFRTRF